jgi:P4 family phage/plasmid primase-like protien
MLSSLCRFGNEGRTLAHQLSAPYPNYTSQETDKKLLHAWNASGPMTCKEIAKRGFVCPDLGKCSANAPAGLLYKLTYTPATHTGGYEIEVKEEGPSAGEIATDFLSKNFSENGDLTLRYYRGDWWRWNGRSYKELPDTDLGARVARFIDDFTSRKVSTSLNSSVITALKGRCLVPADTELPAWIGENFSAQPAGRVISFSNGILDLDALLQGENVDLQPHTPKLFTPVALPYPFDPKASCQEWIAFLNHNLEGDQERIAVLQEFVGLCLVYDTSFHKFLLMEGEAGTGKSTCTEVITAVLGDENVSNVPLETFGQQFALHATLGKLANITSEVGDIDNVAEGIFKAFVAGDRMEFQRKYRDPISARPTARVIIATNHLPRFLDRSEGIWRRIILLQWNKVIPLSEQDRDLRERIKRNELSGVFLWALAGLARLKDLRGFTLCSVMDDAITDYKRETNPARAFLEDNYEADPKGEIPTGNLYYAYKQYCQSFGYHELHEVHFGKEVRRVFPKVTRNYKRDSQGVRNPVYYGIAPKP